MFKWPWVSRPPFTPARAGVDAERLQSFKGRYGRFYGCTVGIDRDSLGLYHFYGDRKYQFFFYDEIETSDGVYVVTVKSATTNRLHADVRLWSDRRYIEHNIRDMLTRRDRYNLSQPAPRYAYPLVIQFSWDV